MKSKLILTAGIVSTMLFSGCATLLKNEHPAVIKDKVTSPAGTTAYGYAKLEEGRVRDSFIKAINSAVDRAKELG